MRNDSSAFNIPSFARDQAYDFAMTSDTWAIYQELNAIAEEIEKCRAGNY